VLSRFECWNNGRRRRAAHIRTASCNFGGRNSEQPLIRNKNVLVKPQKEWCIGSKKNGGRRQAFISHLHLVFSSHVPSFQKVRYSAQLTPLPVPRAILEPHHTSHGGLISDICCKDSGEVGQRQHTQSSKPDVAVLGRRERKPGTNMEVHLFSFGKMQRSRGESNIRWEPREVFLNAKLPVFTSHGCEAIIFW